MGIAYPELMLRDLSGTSFLQHMLNAYARAGMRKALMELVGVIPEDDVRGLPDYSRESANIDDLGVP